MMICTRRAGKRLSGPLPQRLAEAAEEVRSRAGEPRGRRGLRKKAQSKKEKQAFVCVHVLRLSHEALPGFCSTLCSFPSESEMTQRALFLIHHSDSDAC